MEFMSPSFLALLAVVPALAAFYYLSLRKKRKSALKFSSLSLVRSAAGSGRYRLRKHIQILVLLAIVALMVLGLADPHIPLEQTKEGATVVLSLDVSGSMQATDYKPTRLEAAKKSARVLLESLKPKDHVGIVIFESGATTAAYLTQFKDKVLSKLESISPREGSTALGDGLALAVDMATSIPNRKKVVILLSDGVSNAGVITPAEAVAYARQNKIQVYTIGMGSEEPVVLGYDFFGNPQYAELDEATLKAIADETGGEYYKSVDERTLDGIYSRISEEIEREEEMVSIKDWFIIAALMLIITQFYIQYGRYRILQ